MNSNPNDQLGLIPMDASIGISNRLEKDQMNDLMIRTLTDLTEVLQDHCGPYGKYAAITSPVNPSAEPIFTKDGINLIRSIDYASPIQQFIRHTLMYMGSRVEATAGDGTTSAMIIMAAAMQDLISAIKSVPCTYQQLKEVYYQYILSPMERYYQTKYCYTLESSAIQQAIAVANAKDKGADAQKRVIRYVAYSQAYTSSHGDIELSNLIADLFADTPKDVWELFVIEKAAYETPERYVVDTECCQWKIESCSLFPLDQMSEDFGTKSIRTAVRTIVTDRGIAVGDEYTQPVRDQIVEAIEADQPLTVILTGSLDTSTNMWLTSLFNRHPNHHLSIYMVPPGDYGLWNDLPYLKIASGENPVEVMEFTLDYTFNGRDLVITKGLYEDPSDTKGCHLHPFYRQADYPVYNDFVDKLKTQIERQASTLATRESNKALAVMKKMLSKLIVVNRSYFRVGGSAYDNAAAVDVAIDVLTAVKNTLTQGWALGANTSLKNFFLDVVAYIYSFKNEDHCTSNAKLTQLFALAFLVGINAAHDGLLRYAPKEAKDMKFDDYSYCDIMHPKQRSNHTFVERCCQAEVEPPTILQPISTDIAIVKRFGEVALRFIKTARIISEGGLYVNSTKRKE